MVAVPACLLFSLLTTMVRGRALWSLASALATDESSVAGNKVMNRSVSSCAATRIFDELRSNPDDVFLLDGGTGEELFRSGVPDDRTIWSAAAVVRERYHGTLRKVHRSFAGAGARAITTNSYGIVPGVGFSTGEIAAHCTTAGRLAREAAGSSVLVFGSLGPLIESYRPDRIMAHDGGVAAYETMAAALSPHVDAFLAETLSCVEESKQAVEAVGRVNSSRGEGADEPLPMLVSYTVSPEGNLRSGEAPPSAVSALLDFAKQQQVKLLAVLFNCSEPEAITLALQRIRADQALLDRLQTEGTVLGAYANRLTPVRPDWTLAESDGPQTLRTDLDPARYCQEFASKWVKELGVKVVGGCCGITPEHIAFLRDHLKASK